ncbi:MAG TPA: hypothetical protein VGG91_17125, partial [Myxococcaceae bacterium]
MPASLLLVALLAQTSTPPPVMSTPPPPAPATQAPPPAAPATQAPSTPAPSPAAASPQTVAPATPTAPSAPLQATPPPVDAMPPAAQSPGAVPPQPATPGALSALPPPASSQQNVNLSGWDSNQLPAVYERSDQLPITDQEVSKMSQAGFPPDQLVRTIAERSCACDASPEGLIRLRVAGVDASVISAVSKYALKPNRALNLEVTLDFIGESTRSRNAYLYVFVDDGDVTRVMSTNIDELLRRPNAHETTV